MSTDATTTTGGLVSVEALRKLRQRMTACSAYRPNERSGRACGRTDCWTCRVASAVRLEMRGENYSPDDKADARARIIAEVLSETAGVMPAMNDSRYSLTMTCGRAATIRRSLDRERARDHKAAEIKADLDALDVSALAPDLDALPLPQTADDAAQTADLACHRLGYCRACTDNASCRLNGHDPAPVSVYTLVYRCVRDDREKVAAELGITPATLDRRISEGAKLLRSKLPAVKLARLLLGAVPADLSRPAVGHGKTWTGKLLRQLAADWREGTDAGSYPTRPADADHARELCSVSSLAGRRRNPAASDKQVQADALRNLGYALGR